MPFYYVGDVTSENPEEEKTITVGDEITQDELDSLYKAFSITGTYHGITQILNIVTENGFEFKKWMNPSNLQAHRNAGASSERLLLLSNKLVLNYASSIKTFIDMAQRMLHQRKPNCVKEFLKRTNELYDEEVAYRFWANFRNYIVHCSFPYIVFHEAVGCNCEVRCPREHLLEFSNWKHAKADIEKMPEFIDLPGMVDEMSSLIYALYLEFFYYLAGDIMSDYKNYIEFLDRHKVNCPVILEVEAKITKEDGFVCPSMHPLPIEKMMEIFRVMNNHPSINISFT
jgi:hypothetical protein